MSDKFYKKYQLLLSGGQLTAVISNKDTAVELWQWVKSQKDIIFFYKIDRSCTKLTEFVTDPRHIIGIDDIFPDEEIDLNSIKKRRKVWEENQEKQKKLKKKR